MKTIVTYKGKEWTLTDGGALLSEVEYYLDDNDVLPPKYIQEYFNPFCVKAETYDGIEYYTYIVYDWTVEDAIADLDSFFRGDGYSWDASQFAIDSFTEPPTQGKEV